MVNDSVENYEKADCTLFRTPPIDFAPIRETLERAIVEAYKRGGSAQDAVQRLLTDQKLLDPIQKKLEHHLEFQKGARMLSVERQKQSALQNYDTQRQESLGQIAATLGTQVEAIRTDYSSKSKTFDGASQAHSAAGKRLQTLRTKVREDLNRVGGIESYNALIELNSQLLSSNSQAPTSPANLPAAIQPIQSPVPDTPKSDITAVASQYQAQPTPSSSLPPAAPTVKLESIVQQLEPNKPKGFFKRIAHTFGKFFGYYKDSGVLK